MTAPKVFISFADAERDLATRLHSALSERGADVFQFLESAEPGSVAWGQVLESISLADWFVIIVSKASVASKAVQTEVEFAFHHRVNNEERKPTIIPLMYEDVAKPAALAMFSELPFQDTESGLARLCETIGLSGDTIGINAAGGGAIAQSESHGARKIRLIGLIAALVIVSIVGIRFFWEGDTQPPVDPGPHVEATSQVAPGSQGISTPRANPVTQVESQDPPQPEPGVYLAMDAKRYDRVTDDLLLVVDGVTEEGELATRTTRVYLGRCLARDMEKGTRLTTRNTGGCPNF